MGSILALLLFAVGVPCVNPQTILQSPGSVVQWLGSSTSLSCFLEGSSDPNLYWYRQMPGGWLEQLSYSISQGSATTTGPGHIKGKRPDKRTFHLEITSLRMNDTATYYCAWSTGGGYELHFGAGTRLTVLGEGEHSSPPKVTIFSPSTQELKEKNKATIVCLVTDFYPDHIILTWSVNGKERKEGVNTETPKVESTGKYSLISRLRVTSQEWQNSYNKFVCKVDFYDETKASSYEESILGIDCDGGIDQAKETYLRTANLGKLVYILLIFKSILYGAFVMGWKLRKK